MEAYDNHHDSGLGYGALLCAMADSLCFDLAHGIKKGHISEDFQSIPSESQGSAAQEAADALAFLRSKGAARLCEWISQATLRKVEVSALAREAVKRSAAIGKRKREPEHTYRDCRLCGGVHRSKKGLVCWRCRDAARGASQLQTHVSV